MFSPQVSRQDRKDTSSLLPESFGHNGDSPSKGVGESTVSGRTGATVSESSPEPFGGELLFGTSVLTENPAKVVDNPLNPCPVGYLDPSPSKGTCFKSPNLGTNFAPGQTPLRLKELLRKIDEKDRISGRKELSELLQPEHPFFADKRGFIESLSAYRHGEESTHYHFYPRVKGHLALNPYRKKQLSRGHTARFMEQLDFLIEARKLDDFKLVKIEAGFATEISVYLSKQPRATNLAWAMWQRFLERVVAVVGKESSGQACRANLHLWSTENPFKSHYHFHAYVPNYRLVEVPLLEDDEGQPARELVRRSWHRQRGGTLVPYSEDELGLLRAGWRKIQLDFAHWHKISMPALEQGGEADVRVKFLNPRDTEDRARIIHDVTYFGRHPLEDYAKFTIQHPDCGNPPEVLVRYQNRARSFGWWSGIKQLTKECDSMKKRERLSQLTGKPMIYVGTISVEGLIERSGGDLGYIDFVKGKPVIGDLTPEEVERLRKMAYHPPPRPPPWPEEGWDYV